MYETLVNAIFNTRYFTLILVIVFTVYLIEKDDYSALTTELIAANHYILNRDVVGVQAHANTDNLH